MTVSVSIPVTHWEYTGGQKEIELDPAPLADVLFRLHQTFPRLGGRLLDADGGLCPGIEVAVNNREIFPFDPAYRLEHGDRIRISSIITGG